MDDYSSDFSTTGTLLSSGFTTGNIETSGDADWFRIQLTAGSEYRFYLQGSQINDGVDPGGTLAIPYLKVLDGGGQVLTTSVSSLGNNVLLDFVAPTTGAYFLEASSWVPGGVGTYTLSSRPFASVGDIADFMVNGFWAPGVVQTNVVGAHHFGHDVITVNISALNATERGLALAAFDAYHQISRLSFAVVSGAADITYLNDGNHIAEGGVNTGQVTNGVILSSYVHISSDWVSSAAPDTQAFQIYLHETGHALGLGHPGPYNGGHINFGTSNSFANDTLQWSVMSDMGVPGQALAGRVTTLQMADVAAIQSMYGVAAARADDTVYGFHDTAGPAFDLSSFHDGFLFTLYDTGGTDTLDASGFTMSQVIDLRSGNFSSVGGFRDNVAIYSTSVIENAVGGSGDDHLIGNAAGNQLLGSAGNDTITAGNGQNVLRGGEGNDSILGGSGFDDINGNKGDDTISDTSGGDDWLVGGQGNDLIGASAGGNILYGNLGNDTLHGGAGGEIVRGGQGDDSLTGGGGADFISGDRGNDTMSGGIGPDIFHTFSGAGIDRVLDFNVAEGDRVMLDPGTTWTVSQVGADTVIDMGNGDQMVLVGVQMSTLTGAWIFAA